MCSLDICVIDSILRITSTSAADSVNGNAEGAEVPTRCDWFVSHASSPLATAEVSSVKSETIQSRLHRLWHGWLA